jgi:ribonuclease Z
VALRPAGLELEGFSISGLATYVLVPEFDACFDLGHCSVEAAKLRNVFLSHVHQDHSLGVPRHRSLRAMWGMKPPRFYCPAESAAGLREFLDALDRLEERTEDERGADIVGVSPGDVVPLGRRKVQVFDVTHRIASRGFTVFETRRKLKPAFLGQPGEALARAHENGEILYDYRDIQRFTYIGDSTLATLRAHPEVSQSEVLVLESTYLPGRDPVVPGKWGHTHLLELVELAREVPGFFGRARVVLKHFSMKYDPDEVRRALGALPPELREQFSLMV